MTEVFKTDYASADLLSYNCRYLHACEVHSKYFGDIAKDIGNSTGVFEALQLIVLVDVDVEG